MGKNHNKKRNVGIIYELLLRSISSSLVDNETHLAEKALKIIENRFDKSSAVYREFRLFNALVKSTVSDSAVAAAILTEAKQAARRMSPSALNREKSLLIRDINYTLGERFYHRRVPNYTFYATVQTLLNEWRNNDTSNLAHVVEYEGKVVEWLLSQKNELIEESPDNNVDDLVISIMTKKINDKYKNKLNENQKDILRQYTFSMQKDEGASIKKILKEMKTAVLENLKELQEKTENAVILSKISDVKEKVEEASIDIMSDSLISKYLVISQLNEEIKEALNVTEQS